MVPVRSISRFIVVRRAGSRTITYIRAWSQDVIPETLLGLFPYFIQALEHKHAGHRFAVDASDAKAHLSFLECGDLASTPAGLPGRTPLHRFVRSRPVATKWK